MKENHGYIKENIDPSTHWIMGGEKTKMRGTVLNPSGNWSPYIPDGEPQSNGSFDAEDCTTMGTLNSLETLLGFLGYKVNYSKRANAIAAGTTPNGNSPQTVAETIRTVLGNVNESDLPFTMDITTWPEYYSPKPLTIDLIKKGQQFWTQWDFNHQWILEGSEATPEIQATKLMAALQSSPVSLGVYAWHMGPNGYYVRPEGGDDNHWVSLVDYKEGEYWEIFDSYDGYLKQLDWNFDFTAAKGYSVVPHQQTLNIFSQILGIIAQILHIDSLIIKPLPPAPNGPVVTNPPATKPINGEANHPGILAWALGIKKAEGGNANYPNICNPGNLRYTAYTKSLGATGHTPLGNYAIFPDEATGLGASPSGEGAVTYHLNGKGLCQFLVDAANNELIPYKNARTFIAFELIFAQPKMVNGMYPYVEAIADALKAAGYLKLGDETDISTLLL